MKGNVIGFDPSTETGAISGHDGRRYEFLAADWHGRDPPRHGDIVEFSPNGDRAAQIRPLEPRQEPPTLLQFWFSPRGRVSRSQYWLKYFLPVFAVTLVLDLIVSAVDEDSALGGAVQLVLNLFMLVTLWPGIAILVKRIHDRDKPGWLALLLYVPMILLVVVSVVTLTAAATEHESAAGTGGAIVMILAVIVAAVALWFFVEFGCLRGTIGANRYGPDPVPRAQRG